MSRADIDQLLVSELRVLEELRRSYVARHPASGLEREDPDIQRIIEALALFSVRSRLSQQRNIQSTWRRLFASYFDFLLAPLPSCAVLQAVVTPRLVETVTIERGTLLRLTTTSGKTASFTTLADLRVLPIRLDSLELKRFDSYSELVLRFTTRFPRTDAVEVLRLFVHCAGSYNAAVLLHYQLRSYLKQITVSYEPRPATPSLMECEARFSEYAEQPFDTPPLNPVEQVRRFFNFPEQELFIDVKVPRSQGPWTSFTLSLKLDPDFAPEQVPATDTFQLFAVPIENRFRQPAAPILCTGTASEYAIREVDPAQQTSLVRVHGVSRMEKTGLVPLRPAYLTAADSEETFEVEEREDDAHSGSFLLVRMPRALLSPVKLLVDAEWHQPWFAREAVGKLRIAAPYRSLEGLSLQTLVPVRPPQETLLRRDTQGLLVLLALRMKSQLTRPELLRVLDVLGTISGSPYQRMPSLLRELNVEIVLDSALRGSGLCHRYRATLNRYAEHEEALVWHFCTRLQELLDHWNAEASVELTVDAGGLILSSPLPGRLPETPVAG